MTSDAPSLDPVDEESHVHKATINDLGSGRHFAVYTRALERVISTDVSQSTYAQVVDGAPLGQTIKSMPPRLLRGHPVYEHSELCEGAQEKVGQILDASKLHIL